MKATTHPNTRYGKGSTGFHTAVSPQASDGGSGGVPLQENILLMPKPAVLVTLKPEPSQGTPSTAISAELSDTGVAPSRLRGLRMVASKIRSKLHGWQAQLYKEYLVMELLALCYVFMLRYLRLPVRVIWINRERMLAVPVLPNGVEKRFVHDCREALFPARSRVSNLTDVPCQIPAHPRSSQPMTD